MRSRALAAIVVAVATVLTAVLLSPATGDPATASTTTSAAERVAFVGGLTAWTPSRNAKVTKNRRTSVVQVAPRRARSASITMRSSASRRGVGPVGTTVSATARLRTSQPGRRLTLRVLEISGGRVVASHPTTVRPSSRGWRTVKVSLRTSRPDSRVRLQVQAKRVGKRQTVRLARARVTATRPSAAGSLKACAATDYSDPAQGVRTFSDEFDGTEINRAAWRVRDNTFLNQDQAWITKDAVSVHDGYLDITGRRLPAGQEKINLKALYPGVNTIRDYSTGYVDTIGLFGQKYGHFEVRAWVPSAATMSRGIWPAFWLRADHQPGEIDPMESYGAPSIRSTDPSSSYEWNSWADTAQGSQTGIEKQMTHGRADVGTDKIWQGWHTYGVNWSPGCLRYLYDGRTVGLVDFAAPGTKPYFLGPTFDDTFHIRLNMQVGSSYWGWADQASTRDEFSYRIDWVRVYQGNDLR